MLSPEKVKEFLMHEDAEVRNEAAYYLEKHFDPNLATADDFWPAIEKYGMERSSRLVQAVPRFARSESFVERLADLLRGFNDHRLQEFDHVVRSIPTTLLYEHGDKLLANALLYQRFCSHVQRVRDLGGLSWDQLWNRLIEHSNHLDKDWDADRYSQGRIICEFIVARGTDRGQRALDILNQPRKDSWEELFSIVIVGGCRRTEAIPLLLPRMDLYDDQQVEMAGEALVAMGDPMVVTAIADFHGNQNNDFIISVSNVLAAYPVPESQQLLLKWARRAESDEQKDLSLDVNLCSYLLRHLPDEPEVIEYIKGKVELSHKVFMPLEHLDDGLLTLGKMIGMTFPEESEWRNRLAKRGMNRITEMMHSRADWEEKAPREFDEHPITGGAKVGRNDPCPCGSGKKYKKCCLGKGTIQ